MKIFTMVSHILKATTITIRKVASFIGNLTAAFDAVSHGRLYYRHIEAAKIAALKDHRYNYDSPCRLSPASKQDMKVPCVDRVIYTGSSLLQWGEVYRGIA